MLSAPLPLERELDGRSMEHRFDIVIGLDPVTGRGAMFSFSSNRRADDARRAFVEAKQKHPELCPEKFWDDMVSGIPVVDMQWKTRQALLAAGCPLPTGGKKFRIDDVAAIVVWFCKLGDPEMITKPCPPMNALAFYWSP